LKKSFIIAIIHFFYVSIYSQNFSINGTVTDGSSGETIIGASILLKPRNSVVSTNPYGQFSVSAPAGTYSLLISYIGFKTVTQEVNLNKNTTINVALALGENNLNEVEITTKGGNENIKNSQMSAIQLDMAEIKKIPAFMGEVDILKTIQLLPGVKNAGDGNSGFYVRGGGPDQNLILLDEAPIYNASHLFGFFSVFNGDAIKNVNLIKGGMPAQYGGRLSSVLDITMKDGNNQRFEVDGGIGVIASRLTIQGPIVKNKASFLVSARRTYIDVLAKPFIEQSEFKGTSYFFYDLNAKLNYNINERNRFFLSGYFGRDKFTYVDSEEDFKTTIPWGNASACFRWNHVFNPKLFANLSCIYTNYKFSFSALQQDFEATIKSGIFDQGLKYDLNYYPNPRHNIKAGLHYTYHIFTPTSVSAKQGETVFDLGKPIRLYSHEAAIYLSDDWDVTTWLKVNAGLRFGNFTQVGPFNRYNKDFVGRINDTVSYSRNKVVSNYNGLEPRMAIRFGLNNSTSIKTSYTKNFQYVHLASFSSVSLPTDVWMPCTEVIKPQISEQYAIGLFKNFADDVFESSIETYYKTMANQIEFKEGAQPADNVYDNPDNGFTFGKGWAYGVEVFFKKRTGKLTGWVGYTLSWAWRQFDAINFGQQFLAKYDRRHDASLVMAYDANKRWTFGLVYVYGTGNRGTLPNGFFIYEGSLSSDYGLRNSYQFKPYHRLDLNVTYTPNREKKLSRRKEKLLKQYANEGRDTINISLTKKWLKNYENSFTLSVFNAYNRYNPYFIYLTRSGDFANGTLKVGAKQVSLFPVLPSLTWNFKF
jgi:hypothetical protein